MRRFVCCGKTKLCKTGVQKQDTSPALSAFHKKIHLHHESGIIYCNSQYEGFKLCTEVFTLLLLSRFPDSWFIALLLLLVSKYNGLLKHCSPNTVTGSLRILTWFPFHRRCAVNADALNRFMELYNTIIPFHIPTVKHFSFSHFPVFALS